MSTSLLTTLKRYRTRRFAATMAAAAVLSGGVMALTAGTASAMPDCVGMRAYQLRSCEERELRVRLVHDGCARGGRLQRLRGPPRLPGSTCRTCRTGRGASMKRGANALSDWLVTR